MLVFGSVGCRTPQAPTLAPAVGLSTALYKVRVERVGEKTRRFRMLLFAAEPDRIHAEVVSPIGGTVLILDGGRSQVAVSIPRDRITYYGEATPELFEKLLGVPIGLEDWVQAIHGRSSRLGDFEVQREGKAGALPIRLDARQGQNRLLMELRRLEPLTVASDSLGLGRGPDDFEQRPLAELLGRALPTELESGSSEP